MAVHESTCEGGMYELRSAPFDQKGPLYPVHGPFNAQMGAKKKTNGAFSISPLSSGDGQLQRQLKARHITMISMGGVIGMGLFLGSAHGLANGGPLGLLLGYIVMGSIAWAMMISLGEMIAHLPLPGGHITLASRFVTPSFSLVMGWMYWYTWALALPAELAAASVLVSYWNSSINPAVFITIFLAIVVVINMFGTRVYGETEYYLALLKILTIVGLIILGIVLDAGGGPNHRVFGVKFWQNPGPFVQYLGIEGAKGRFLGFFSVLINASFAYQGLEITALTGGEARNPRKSLPRAIKTVYIRILLFYVLGAFVIGLLVASNDPRLTSDTGTAASSPFVLAMTDSGIKILPSIVNAALLVSAWSAASSDLYTSSRALYGLAVNGNAPVFCAKITSWGLPWVGVVAGTCVGLLAFMSAGSHDASTVFTWFANMTSVAGMVNWAGISFIYLRFYYGARAQSIDRQLFPYRGVLQPYAAWYSLVACFIVLFFNGFSVFLDKRWSTATFLTSYIPVMLVPVGYLASWLWNRDKWEDLLLIDFFSGSRESNEEDTGDNTESFIDRVWRWVL